MNIGDLVVSPYTWIVVGICFVGCCYAKRNCANGILFGVVAIGMVGPMWMVMFLALFGPWLALEKMFPEMTSSAVALFASWPEWACFVFHPATLLTGALFLLYCKVERGNTGIVAGYVLPRPRGASYNPFLRIHRH